MSMTQVLQLASANLAGADLYIIPGIDMVNHSTDSSLRNTSLQKKQLPATANSEEGAEENKGTTASYFTLEAGTSSYLA